MNDITSSFDSFKAIVAASKRFILTTHINPDGDGIGSELALALSLEKLGKEAVIVNHSALPDFYEFLNTDKRIIRFDAARDSRLVQDADAIVIVDTNHPDRLASLKDPVLASHGRKIIIDHHLDPHPFADLLIIDDAAAATGEIVFRLLEHLKAGITARMASALYVAILTDSGSFRFPKTDGDLHRITASLIDLGADPVEIYGKVYEQSPVNRLRLLGSVLSGIELFHDGKVAVLTISQEDFAATGTAETDVERFIPFALEIKGVQIALMITELNGIVKISFRSRGDIWINKLAQEFGGNGHKNAAGARINHGNLSAVKKSLVEKSLHYLSP